MPSQFSAQVIDQGLATYKRQAWNLARNLMSRTPATVNEAEKYLESARIAAQHGDWLARQFCGFVQTALSQQKGDPRRASFSQKAKINGEHDATFSAQTREEMGLARSLVNRSRAGDQVATATLTKLAEGNAIAKRIREHALAYAQGGEAAFGAAYSQRHVPTHMPPAGHVGHRHEPSHPKHPPRHPALVKATLEPVFRPQPVSALGAMASSPSHIPPRKGVGAKHPARRLPTTVNNYYGGASLVGSGSTGGPAGGSGPADGFSSTGGPVGDGNPDAAIDQSSQLATDDAVINHDQGLDPTTGQLEHPQAAELVAAARAGSRKAVQQIQDVVRAARSGDPRAQGLAEAIRSYTRTHPEFENEVLDGHAANLSHSHPLTARRVQNIAAGFSGEGQRMFHEHVRNPYGAPSPMREGYMGQVVGRAQAIQAARFPDSSLERYSPRVARELGENR